MEFNSIPYKWKSIQSHKWNSIQSLILFNFIKQTFDHIFASCGRGIPARKVTHTQQPHLISRISTPVLCNDVHMGQVKQHTGSGRVSRVLGNPVRIFYSLLFICALEVRSRGNFFSTISTLTIDAT
jgi:hypothetical protein